MAENNQEILTKAMQLSSANGWKPDKYLGQFKSLIYYDKSKIVAMTFVNKYPTVYSTSLERLIFNHDFARALWGDEVEYGIIEYKGANQQIRGELVSWKLNLQQMVIADDPIKYLGENI